MAALFIDFLPVLVFFAAYWTFDLMVATAALIVATVVLAAYNWLRKREVNRIQLLTAVLVLLFGGATLLLEDETFIKWKPTVVYWLFIGAFAGSQLLGRGPLIRRLFGEGIKLPDAVWARLNLAWVAFFAAASLLNLWVAYTFDTGVWVTFKLFGLLGLTVLFAIGQGFYIARYVEE